MGIVRCLPISALCVLAAANLGRAATFVVNDTTDALDMTPTDNLCLTAGGTCTLRAAVQQANALTGPDTIMLPAGTYTLTISGRCEDATATGDLDITDDLTITGAGAGTTIIDGNGIDRVFDVWAHVDASGVTIRNGNAGTATCPSGVSPNGGGIYSAGATAGTTSLTLTDVTVIGNMAAHGAVDLVIAQKPAEMGVTGNTATHGGGIENDLGSTLVMSGVTVSGNMASVAGGGIENEAGAPGATLTNVTVSGNTAGTGAGVSNDGNLTLSFVTISGNSLDGSGDHTIRNTILANSSSGANCSGGGTLLAEDHNLDSGSTCGFTDPSDLIHRNPDLGPLQDNGGPTFTHALAAGSPAIDAGSGNCPPPATDQRGIMRPVDGNGDGTPVRDIGAFEFQPGVVTTTTTTQTPTTTTTSSTTTGSTTSSTTTTLLPACTTGPTFSSVTCRLQALVLTTQAQVPSGPIEAALAATLTKAVTFVGQAQAAAGQAHRRPAKRALAKAIRSLRKFVTRLRSRKAKGVIPADISGGLQTNAAQIRGDVVALQRSL